MVLLLMIEILHDLIYQKHRNSCKIVQIGGAEFLPSRVFSAVRTLPGCLGVLAEERRDLERMLFEAPSTGIQPS